MLSATLAASGAEVEFHGQSDVPPVVWNSLGRTVAPGEAREMPGGTLVVPLSRFLANRQLLRAALIDHACEFEVDEPLSELLDRGRREVREVRILQNEAPVGIAPQDLKALLAKAGFKRELKAFQLRDLGHLVALSHGANFSVPGAGKTTVAYAAHAIERQRGRVERLLVVAPNSAFGAWTEEVDECLEEPLTVARFKDRGALKADVLLINYQLLVSRRRDVARWVLGARTHVILDEAHRMKRGKSGAWGDACLELAHLAERRDILTGTPAPQHPKDFVALLDFTWPQQSARLLPREALKPDPPPATMVEVSRRLAPFFTRTSKAELGLEEPVRRVELVTMKPLQAEIYEALRTKLRTATNVGARERAQWGAMGQVVMYLLEAASNPTLLSAAVTGADGVALQWPELEIPMSSPLAEKVMRYGQHEVPAKFERLVAMVDANKQLGLKTLVWSNFIGTISALSEKLLLPYQPAVVHGAVPSAAEEMDFTTRESELRQFREDPDCHVLLANPAAMSEGVSLHHHCHDAIYVDRTYNAGQYLQSIDRIHRLGLPPGTETRITFLVCRGTVDETVDDRIKVKAERLGAMLSDSSLVTMSLPDEDDGYVEAIQPDSADLDSLLKHLRRD